MSNARNISKLGSLAAHIANLIGLSNSKAAIDAKVAETPVEAGVSSVNGSTGAVTVHNGYTNIVVLTASGNWTVPAGITRAKVTCIGAGGGQAGTSTTLDYAPAGGVGGTVIKHVTGLTPGAQVAVTVGAGGAAGASNGGSGTAGGSTTFAAPGGTLTAGGGGTIAANANRVSGGAGGTASGGSFNLTGLTPHWPQTSVDAFIPHPIGSDTYGRSSHGSVFAAAQPGSAGGPGAIIIEY